MSYSFTKHSQQVNTGQFKQLAFLKNQKKWIGTSHGAISVSNDEKMSAENFSEVNILQPTQDYPVSELKQQYTSIEKFVPRFVQSNNAELSLDHTEISITVFPKKIATNVIFRSDQKKIWILRPKGTFQEVEFGVSFIPEEKYNQQDDCHTINANLAHHDAKNYTNSVSISNKCDIVFVYEPHQKKLHAHYHQYSLTMDLSMKFNASSIGMFFVNATQDSAEFQLLPYKHIGFNLEYGISVETLKSNHNQVIVDLSDLHHDNLLAMEKDGKFKILSHKNGFYFIEVESTKLTTLESELGQVDYVLIDSKSIYEVIHQKRKLKTVKNLNEESVAKLHEFFEDFRSSPDCELVKEKVILEKLKQLSVDSSSLENTTAGIAFDHGSVQVSSKLSKIHQLERGTLIHNSGAFTVAKDSN